MGPSLPSGVLGQAVWEGGREERNTVLALKEEVTKSPGGGMYKQKGGGW